MSSDKDMPAIDTTNLSFHDTVKNIRSHAIITLDSQGQITSWNEGAEYITGWKKREVMGKSFAFLYSAEDRERGKPHTDLVYARQNGNFQEEATRLIKSGEFYLADVAITAITDNHSQLGFVLIAKDTTQRRRDEVEQLDANALLRDEIERRKTIEKALKESNEELDAFASAAGHDLQEPLRMVVSYLQLIEKRYAQSFDQDGLDFLAFAIDGATRMKALISDLVEYSRIETLGKPFKQIDANEVLSKVIDNLEVSIQESGVQVTSTKLPIVWSDEVQFGELLQNLLANAIKFGNNAGITRLKIHIAVQDEPQEYVFSIADNGPGIDTRHFKTIFLIFKQLGNKSIVQGSGVGLAICKKILKRHKGRIWVESELGHGATFYFAIPKVKEQS